MQSIRRKLAFLAVLFLVGGAAVFAPICVDSGGARSCGNTCTGDGEKCSCEGECTDGELIFVATS